MSSRWAEGVDFQILDNGKIKCLHCGRELSGKPALGPHLSKCVKPTVGAPPKPSETTQEFGLDEKENFINVLKQFGVRYAEGIAGFVEGFGFQNLDVIDEALRLAGSNFDKRKLIVQYWSNHIGKPVPPTLVSKWSQPTMDYMQPQAFPNQQSLSREELEKWYETKRKEEELAQLRAEVQELRNMLSEGNPKKSSELEEIKKLLLEKEKNEILARLNSLERYVMGPVSNAYGVLALGIKEVADVIKSSPLRHYVLTGQLPYPEKEVEEGARQSIFSRLPSRFVAEE